MSRNKMSAGDRNNKLNFEAEQLLKRNNPEEIIKYISTIRSKALRDLCIFWVVNLEEPFFYNTYSPEQIAKALGYSERKVYDLRKACTFISNVGGVAFDSMLSKLSAGDKK